MCYCFLLPYTLPLLPYCYVAVHMFGLIQATFTYNLGFSGKYLIELTAAASRVFRGEGKDEKTPEPVVVSNPSNAHYDRPRSIDTQVAPWEAQKPPPVELPRKVVKKKSSLFTLNNQRRYEDKVVTTDASAPPVPPIPAKFKYTLFPQDKPLCPFHVAARSPSSEQRPDTAGSAFSSRAIPHPQKAIASSKFRPIQTPYSKESGLPKSPSQVNFPFPSESSASTQKPDTSSAVSVTSSAFVDPQKKLTRIYAPIMTPWSNEKGLPKSPLQAIAPIHSPWSNEAGLTESPPKPVPWPGQSRSPSPASSVRTTVHSPQSPCKLTPPRAKPFEDTTFGVPDEELRALFKDHPAVKRFHKMLEPGGKGSSDIVYPPGIPAVEYHKMKALYDLTGSPFNEGDGGTKKKGEGKGKKPQTLPQSSSLYSLETVTPFSVHQHLFPRSAPLNPPLPYRPIVRSTKSATSSPTSPDFAKLSAAAGRKSSSSSARPGSKDTHTTSPPGRRSGYTSSSLGRSSTKDSTAKNAGPGALKIKSKRSLRDLFQRGGRPPPIPSLRHYPISNPIPIAPSRADSPPTVSGSTPEFSEEFWERDTLVAFSIPVSVPDDDQPVPDVTAALLKHTKRAGPPPMVPARPGDGKVDLDIVRMRGVGDGRMMFVKKPVGSVDEDEDEGEGKVRGAWIPVPHQAPPGVDMKIRRADGEVWEKFSHERYSQVERIEKGMKGMVVDDFVLGEKEFVEDI
ncbi:hypothetical protein PMIN07_009048 [Paraphaeosphaeria minitans]